MAVLGTVYGTTELQLLEIAGAVMIEPARDRAVGYGLIDSIITRRQLADPRLAAAITAA